MIDYTAFDFNDIRPFRDHEVPEVIERVLKNRNFEQLIAFVYPDTPKEQVFRMMRSCRTIFDFQKNISRTAVKTVVHRSSDQLTWSGFENISRDKGHLFISNHRDIILDSAILNICLIDEQIPTTETAIGSNLLGSELAADLSKLNKNFIVKRNVPQKELYSSSLKLSAYIHHAIKERQSSVWLAQREGRTKDGLDLTQPGLLKMLTIGYEGAYADCFESLRILPMCISYEFDPCDFLKVKELKRMRQNETYTKGKHEDLQSMMTGALGRKGRIHLQIAPHFDDEIETLRGEQNKNEKIRILAQIIDRKIHSNYKLWPGNYVAHDLLYPDRRIPNKYTAAEKEKFEKYISGQLDQIENADETDKDILLHMYANPVISFERSES
jgi:hypothetical protein